MLEPRGEGRALVPGQAGHGRVLILSVHLAGTWLRPALGLFLQTDLPLPGTPVSVTSCP